MQIFRELPKMAASSWPAVPMVTPTMLQPIAEELLLTRRLTKVFFDGGCRPNPGRIEAAVVVSGATYFYDDLGTGTNSDAEWLALIQALELSRSLGLARTEFIGDALEVVRQANRLLGDGPAAPDHAASPHAAAFLALARAAPPTRIRWIKRQQNLAGIALARRHPR